MEKIAIFILYNRFCMFEKKIDPREMLFRKIFPCGGLKGTKSERGLRERRVILHVKAQFNNIFRKIVL